MSTALLRMSQRTPSVQSILAIVAHSVFSKLSQRARRLVRDSRIFMQRNATTGVLNNSKAFTPRIVRGHQTKGQNRIAKHGDTAIKRLLLQRSVTGGVNPDDSIPGTLLLHETN